MPIVQTSSSTLQPDSQATRFQSGKCYDLAIIGAGISSAYTLIHYLLLLEQQFAESKNQLQPKKIVVTEKSCEFWTGIPYGSRSGKTALLISPLIEFIPQRAEREHFVDWLNANREWLFDPQVYSRGELSHKWLQANTVDMDRNSWDNLFIPRHVFGLYLQQRVVELIELAVSKGSIEIDLINADVWDVQRDRDLYRVDFTTTEGDTYFTTEKLVLAIGSPPNVAFAKPVNDRETDVCYIDNMYEPSLDANLDRICKSLERQTDRQVLIVGSNAGTLDTLYSINNSKIATDLIEKFIILSPNAAFPHRISREVPALYYTPQHLVKLVESETFTAKQIFEAVRADVADATAANINISDIHGDISKATMQGLNRLSAEEQAQFVFTYAVEIGKLQRRAGGEYLDVVGNSIDRDKLAFIKGKFVNSTVSEPGNLTCEYIDGDDRQQKTINSPIGVIINCAGFQDVTKSSSLLIQNLIRREICISNQSQRGFVINKNFEASKNCYVMGPLVAGNIDGNFRIWHAESCQRIIGLSQHLASVLMPPAPEADVDAPSFLVNAA
ncbi:FAD/NAD(P)-binding protein [Chamaesiphon sp. GL140_3_metabinner_50]|uniref:FAD/NAD(P)-binding protein n=1 Tax=Chamaesiphon sp. GL140_3_metabinner_50 TaxID=2970812 RepID=UPI0025E14C3F|nr:FAD/NAD(P)-binding protein [Chamaesiphon sp. GL140_3_metabinner_50]